MIGKYIGWDARKHNRVINALNKGLPPERCGVDLNDAEREAYLLDLKWLLHERKMNPGVPISYELLELEIE